MYALIIEPDEALAGYIQALLESSSFRADIIYDSSVGLDYAACGIYDLLIIDALLADPDGYTLTHTLRRGGNRTPVLLMTPRLDLEGRIRALESGADYCLTFDFDAREFYACVNALVQKRCAFGSTLCYGNTKLDLSACTLSCGGDCVPLSAKEFHVMELLLESKSNIIPKDILLAKVWGYDSNAVENNVEVYIGFLRKKLTKIHSDIRIEAVRRLGYRLICAA